MIRIILVFLGISLFGSIPIARSIENCELFSQTNCKPCLRPQSDPNKRVENKAPNVTKLDLDRVDVRLPSPNGSPPKYPSYSKEMSVRVQTTSEDPEGDPLMHTYTVTAGRPVGTGANVVWDLNGVWPGTYTITVGVDDGCGVCGTTATKTVTVLPAENAPACLCPEIRIDSLNGKISSTVPVFSAYISGPLPPGISYNWSVSAGAVESGQGTRTIKVRPPEGSSGQDATVTLEVTGIEPGCDCPRTVTRSFKF
jgi:hypothetical protein